MLENSHLYGLTETEMAFLAGSFFGGGSDSVGFLIAVIEDTLLKSDIRLLRHCAQY